MRAITFKYDVLPAARPLPTNLRRQSEPTRRQPLISGRVRNYSNAAYREAQRFSQRKDHQLMQDRLRAALSPDSSEENTTLPSFIDDATQTLCFLGLDQQRARETCNWIIATLRLDKPLVELERDIFQRLKSIVVDPSSGLNLIDAIEPKLTGRAELIFSQISPYLKEHAGQKILDFGAGDGGVTQLIFDHVSRDTVGIDVRAYGKGSVPIQSYDGRNIPFADASFDCIVSTNVLHHADDNQQCLQEIRRVLRQKGSAVVIETVPLGDTEEEARRNWERTFLNDYFYNRLLHDADVPVPGTFETLPGWAQRFTEMNFKVRTVEDFGIDQGVIADRHGLLHVEKL